MFGVGEMAQNLDNSHQTPEWEFCGTAYNANTNYANVETHSNASLQREYRENIVETHSNASLRRDKVFIKIHNTLKVGDRIEIVLPKYDIIKMRVKKMVDAETGEELKEAHGGQGRTVVIKSDVMIPPYSVIRRKI